MWQSFLRSTWVPGLLASLLGHASVFGLLTYYGNQTYRSGRGGTVVELLDASAVGSAAKGEKGPRHSHRTRHQETPSLPSSQGDEPKVAALGGAQGETTPTAGGSLGLGTLFGEEEVDVPAKLTFMPKLPYPRPALRRNLEGEVELYLVLDSTGTIRQVEVVRGGEDGFGEAALLASHQMRFRPAEKDGVPVAVHVHWILRFRIDD